MLVASDAVGMGLNLNIRRVVFSTVYKPGRTPAPTPHPTAADLEGGPPPPPPSGSRGRGQPGARGEEAAGGWGAEAGPAGGEGGGEGRKGRAEGVSKDDAAVMRRLGFGQRVAVTLQELPVSLIKQIAGRAGRRSRCVLL